MSRTQGCKESLVYPPVHALNGGAGNFVKNDKDQRKSRKKFVVPNWCKIPGQRYKNVRVEVMKNGQMVASFPLSKRGSYLFGRKRKVVNIRCDHGSISGQHCAIVHDGKVFSIIDVESTHGTKLNGKKLIPHELHELHENDQIKLGGSTRIYIFKGYSEKQKKLTAEEAGIQQILGHGKISENGANHERNRRRKEREKEIAMYTASFTLGPALPSDMMDKRRKEGILSTQDAVKQDYHANTSQKEEEKGTSGEGGKGNTSRNMTDEFLKSLKLPVSHEANVFPHKKLVTSISIDKAGARMTTASMDYHIHMFDFHGMKEKSRPFRDIEPCEGHAVMSTSYSSSGEHLIVGVASKPKILNRDGVELIKFRKGDPYLHDMSRTVGHVSQVTCTDWHPTDRDVSLTCSTDGTVRTWNMNGKTHFDELLCWQVIKCKSRRGVRCGVTSCSFNHDGSLIAAGLQDGSLRIFRKKPRYMRPDMSVEGDVAHNGQEITCIAFESQGGNLMATRGSDETLKLWDVRRFKKPVKTWSSNLDNVYPTTSCIFSPDGLLVLTGTSVHRQSKDRGKVNFYDTQSGGDDEAPKYSVSLGYGESAISLCWHSAINQILVGSSVGRIRGLYSPTYSQKGLLFSVGKVAKKRQAYFTVTDESSMIKNPHALPIYGDRPSVKRQRVLDRKDPLKSHKPFMPATGPQRPDFVSPSHNLTQQIITERKRDRYLDKDPREELLKYASGGNSLANKLSSKDVLNTHREGYWVGDAYAQNQPKRILAEKTLEQEAEDQEKALRGDDVTML